MAWKRFVRGSLIGAALTVGVVGASQPAAAQVPTGAIAGVVVDSGGAGIAGVAVTITDGTTATPRTTDGLGRFSATGLAPGSYTATPVLAGRIMVPASRTATVIGDTVALDFVATTPTVAVSGLVLDANGSPLAGVPVALSGGSSAATTTDAGGGYRFAGLAAGVSVTATASLTGFTFAPSNQTASDLQHDVVLAPMVAASGVYRRYFAEGASNGFFSTTIALLNPSATATTATLRFLKSNGQTVEHQVPLGGLTRVTIDPAAVGLSNSDFATVVEADQPLVADRTMHWDGTGYGSHAETSLPQPLTTWYFAEGSTTGSFQLFYLLQNPGATPAQVELRYLRPAPAAPIVKTYTVAPASRRTIYVNQEDPALDETDVSAVVTATNGVPIVAERAMYTNAAGQVFGAGHESAGIAAPASQWFLAEGATGPFFHQFILVANPTATPAPLEFRYLLTNGQVITKTHTVAPSSRLTIGVHAEDPGLANASMSTVVTSTHGVPVLVERAMWWPATGPAWYEAHDSAGATATGTKWAVADGEAGGPSGADTFLLIANTAIYPGSATVTLVFEDGGTATRTYPLLPSSRFTVGVSGQFPEAAGRRFGAIVESVGERPVPIVVERAMYSSPGGVVWAAGSNLLATRLQGPTDAVVIPPPSGDPTQAASVNTAGVLGGDPEAPARLSIPDVVAETTTPVAEVSTATDGQQIVRTKIEIAFRRTATVAQVNSVLDTIGGRIVNAIEGVPILVVRIPDPGSLAALDAVIATVGAQSNVGYVNRVDVPQPAMLPPTLIAGGSLATIDHLIADRAPAAWNVRAALDHAIPPLLFIPDYFGHGAPQAGIDANLVPGDYATHHEDQHGYHVLGTIVGTFDNVASLLAPVNDVVGLYPGLLGVRAIDLTVTAGTALPDLPSFSNELLRLIRIAPRGVIVNTSLQYGPYTPAEGLTTAEAWAEKVRTGGRGGSSLEQRFVQAQAAGNLHPGTPASLHSPAAAATLIPNLHDSSGAALANLANTLVVENRLNTPAEPFEPACLHYSSDVGGTISAIGTDVYSMLDPFLLTGDKIGTSMATPQVAALAAYLWALAPNLTAQDVVARLRATTRVGVPLADPRCTLRAITPAPSIDAYAAVLAVDQGLASPLVRATLLDVTGAAGGDTPDGVFDEHDLQRFVTELTARAGTLFDYSRYDLNGDGRTGGDTVDRFDLDANDIPSWTLVTEPIEGDGVTFNETSLTDRQILCYYAYSILYDGTPDARRSLLPECRGVVVTPPAITLTRGEQRQFSAQVFSSANQAVTWTTTGGSISATGLLTAPTTIGTFTVRATSVADPHLFGDATVTVADPADMLADARLSGRITVQHPTSRATLFEDSRRADLDDSPFPEMPMIVRASTVFDPGDHNLSNYQLTSSSSIPIPTARFRLPSSGSLAGESRCSASGPGVDDGSGGITNPALPWLFATTSGTFAVSTQLDDAGTQRPSISLGLNGTLSRIAGTGEVGSSVTVHGTLIIYSRSAGVQQPDIRLTLPDYTPTSAAATAIAVNRTLTVASPGNIQVTWMLDAFCSNATLQSASEGAGSLLNLSYAVR